MTTQTSRSDITGTEIPVIAPDAGRVAELLVVEGATVREGQDLALFDAA